MVYKIRLFFVFLFLITCAIPAQVRAQNAQLATTGLAAPGLSGTGGPTASYTCNPYSVNTQYIQTDGTAGSRLWICENIGGTYTWENLKGPVATATTGNMTAGLLGLAGCQSTTVTIAGATVGVNAAVASPIGNPTSSSATAGLVNINAYVSAANTVTVSVCALAALTTAAIPYKVLMY